MASVIRNCGESLQGFSKNFLGHKKKSSVSGLRARSPQTCASAFLFIDLFIIIFFAMKRLQPKLLDRLEFCRASVLNDFFTWIWVYERLPDLCGHHTYYGKFGLVVVQYTYYFYCMLMAKKRLPPPPPQKKMCRHRIDFEADL